MTRPDIDAIEARANAATKGPWVMTIPKSSHFRIGSKSVTIKGGFYRLIATGPCNNYGKALPESMNQAIRDGYFIEHARTDIPALIAYVRAQDARIRELEAARDQH